MEMTVLTTMSAMARASAALVVPARSATCCSTTLASRLEPDCARALAVTPVVVCEGYTRRAQVLQTSACYEYEPHVPTHPTERTLAARLPNEAALEAKPGALRLTA